MLIEFSKIDQTSCCYVNAEYSNDDDEPNTEELLALLENAMPYLSVTRRNVMLLYKKGFSLKRISQRLGIPRQKVAWEKKKGIANVKFILPTLKKAKQARHRKRILPVENYEVYLNKRQARICTLYYINEKPFSYISQELGLTPFELLKEHYTIKNILNSVKK